LCESRNAAAAALAGHRGMVLCYDSAPWSTTMALREAPYDVAIDTEQFHHFSAIMALLSGAPVRIGFNINPRRNPLYTHLISYAPDGPEADQFMRLLAPLGIRGTPANPIGILRDTPLPSSTPLLILHPGASTPYKQWPPDRFAALGRALLAPGTHEMAVIGLPHEKTLVEGVATAIGHPARVRTAYPADLAAAASLLRNATLFVGADSGLAHLAAALDVPSVVCFGPSDRQKWGHTGPRQRTVSTDQPCAPCFLFGYHKPCRHRRCIHSIGVEAMLDACRGLLPGIGN